jgi:hypothetical protein
VSWTPASGMVTAGSGGQLITCSLAILNEDEMRHAAIARQAPCPEGSTNSIILSAGTSGETGECPSLSILRPRKAPWPHLGPHFLAAFQAFLSRGVQDLPQRSGRRVRPGAGLADNCSGFGLPRQPGVRIWVTATVCSDPGRQLGLDRTERGQPYSCWIP